MQTKSSSLKYKGVIKKLFRDCPKPNGWFGCFFSVDSLLYDIRLMGVTPIYVVEGMALEVVVTKQTSESGTTEYKLEYADILVRNYSEAMAYLNRSLGLPRPLVQKLYQKYKSNVLDEIVKNPSCLISFGMSSDESEAICLMIRDSRVDAELRSMFPGLANSVYARIMRYYEYSHVISRIYDNPYELYVECSIPFAKVDAFAISHGTALTDDNRIHAVLYYEYHEMNKNGNTYLSLSDDIVCGTLITSTMQFINQPTLTVDRVMKCINTSPYFCIFSYGGNYLLYTKKVFDSEDNFVKIMADMLDSDSLLCKIEPNKKKLLALIDAAITEYETIYNVSLDALQKQGVVYALMNRVSIITGGPGSGKTSVVACIVYCWNFLHRNQRSIDSEFVQLTAPTGRAVKRLSEVVSTLKSHIMKKCHCATIDSRICTGIEYVPTLMIVDESSMMSLRHASGIAKFSRKCQLVFVGDANQLGSIDVGCVFADICSLDFIPKTMLTHCYRANSQLIISNANSVLQGLPFKNCRVDGTSFVYYPEIADDMNYVNHLVTLYLDYLQQGIDFHEITVLSPMRRGLVGVSNLNLVLQEKLNPKYEPASGSPQDKQLQDDLKDENWITTRGFEIPNTYCAGFNKTYTRLRIGDKVMQTTNRSDATYKMKSGDGGGDGIFNGDCAIITGFRQKQVTSRRIEQYIMIETDDDRVYEIKNVYFDELTLAYAMTIHKAQGSEWDVVILSVPASVYGMNQSFSFANRNLLFTGLTRAKKSETIIGSLYSIDRCISTLPYKRNSILPNRLTDATI